MLQNQAVDSMGEAFANTATVHPAASRSGHGAAKVCGRPPASGAGSLLLRLTVNASVRDVVVPASVAE